MRAPVIPSCSIDWGRTFCLPCGVPPETLPAAQRLAYVRGCLVSGDIPQSSYGRFYSKGPSQNEVRRAPKGQATRYVVPRASAADTDPPTALPAGANNVVKTGAFNAAAPDPGTADQVAGKLEAALPYDKLSQRLTPLPIPFQDLDAIRLYFAPITIPPFQGTLGLNEPGLLGDADMPDDLPPVLLETRVPQQGAAKLGEVDPLLLRSPVRGRFRFEPYLLYRWNNAGFTPVGPSNSGRLVIQQPAIPPDPTDFTDTQVRKERLFVIDHVDRAAVAEIAHSVLMLEFKFLKGIVDAFNEEKDSEPKLKVPKDLPKAFGWVVGGVNTLMRSWTAFLSTLAWRSEDTAVASGIPADWLTKFPNHDPTSGERDALIAAVGQVLQNDDWLESLMFFSKQLHTMRLAGYSWNEVLIANGQDPNVKRFPVPSNQAPFQPKNAAQVAQHKRLRLLDDPDFRWIGCYAGCPIGRPSKVYAPPGGAPTVHFPAGALTTYEVEALHAAGTAKTELGLGAANAAGPQAGKAMDLSADYSATELGYACTFAAERSGSDSLHTTVDWLNDLLRGIHFHVDESPFLDGEPLMDPTSAASNPLLEAMRFDDFLKAKSLRRQMDDVDNAGVTPNWLNWWKGKLSLIEVGGNWGDGAGPGPSRSFLKGFTSGGVDPGLLNLTDLALGAQSGFDLFDIESAYLACVRMAEPIASQNQLPLPVLLALMEREGIKQFGPINRGVRNTLTEAATIVWEPRRRTFVDPANPGQSALDPFDGTLPPTDPAERSRQSWLLFPYGLDHFAKPNTAAGVDSLVDQVHQAGVMTLATGESVGNYLHDRLFSSFFLLPALGFANVGIPRIWKRSRRSHWACISLMAGFFRQLEVQMTATPIDPSFTAGQGAWTPRTGPSGWLPPGSSPPDLTGKTPVDPAWKDFITYYALVYVAYNGGAGSWAARTHQVENAGPALPLRDSMLFEHDRGAEIMAHVGRFAIGLDAYMRLDYMTNKFPGDYATATANSADPTARVWGV
jgi:hypothetical protein